MQPKFDDAFYPNITFRLDVTPERWRVPLIPKEMRPQGGPTFYRADYDAAIEAVSAVAPLHGHSRSLEADVFRLVVEVGCPVDLQSGAEAVERYRQEIVAAVDAALSARRRSSASADNGAGQVRDVDTTTVTTTRP